MIRTCKTPFCCKNAIAAIFAMPFYCKRNSESVSPRARTIFQTMTPSDILGYCVSTLTIFAAKGCHGVWSSNQLKYEVTEFTRAALACLPSDFDRSRVSCGVKPCLFYALLVRGFCRRREDNPQWGEEIVPMHRRIDVYDADTPTRKVLLRLLCRLLAQSIAQLIAQSNNYQ